jgi:hypothetical protein
VEPVVRRAASGRRGTRPATSHVPTPLPPPLPLLIRPHFLTTSLLYNWSFPLRQFIMPRNTYFSGAFCDLCCETHVWFVVQKPLKASLPGGKLGKGAPFPVRGPPGPWGAQNSDWESSLPTSCTCSGHPTRLVGTHFTSRPLAKGKAALVRAGASTHNARAKFNQDFVALCTRVLGAPPPPFQNGDEDEDEDPAAAQRQPEPRPEPQPEHAAASEAELGAESESEPAAAPVAEAVAAPDDVPAAQPDPSVQRYRAALRSRPPARAGA